MTTTSTDHTPGRAVRPIPPGTTVVADPDGRTAYLIPCNICGATVPVLQRTWDTSTGTSPEILRHNRFHDAQINAARGRS